MVKTQGDTYRQSQLVLSSQQDLHTEEWGLLDLYYYFVTWEGEESRSFNCRSREIRQGGAEKILSFLTV
jgi:hypothetical protein